MIHGADYGVGIRLDDLQSRVSTFVDDLCLTPVQVRQVPAETLRYIIEAPLGKRVPEEDNLG